VEDDKVETTEMGTPQGAVISPLLANIYLHYVFDLWAARWQRREVKGDMLIVRYADDIVVGFQHEAEAERFRAELTQRLADFALRLHPDKTRLIEFGRHAATNRKKRGLGKPGVFDFLGFTHIYGRSRKGWFQLRRQSRRDRLRVQLRAIRESLWANRHAPIEEQGRWLRQVMNGWFAYHAVPCNYPSLKLFRRAVLWHCRGALRRRGQRDTTSWADIFRLANHWLPKARILHPWPSQRCRQVPKVGAGCLNRARPVLCGG
jgi:RNA-directed DNA polymerase